jgi:hypothetical protein
MQSFFRQRPEEALRSRLVQVRCEYAIAMGQYVLYCGFGPADSNIGVAHSVTATIDSMRLHGPVPPVADLMRLASREFDLAFEDASVEREVARHLRALEAAQRQAAPLIVIQRLAAAYHEHLEHARRYHRRPPPPVQAVVAGIDWADGFPASGEVGSDEAQVKGLALLQKHLTAEQQDQYRREKSFNVQGSAGGHYRIHYGRTINVDVLDEKWNPTSARICFLPRGGLCTGDVMLAQKIALENDEPGALQVANKFGPNTRPLEPDGHYNALTDRFERAAEAEVRLRREEEADRTLIESSQWTGRRGR